jgi:DNA polymerase III subunit beta
MKIVCTQENLKSGLMSVGRIISSNVSLPILNNVLLKTENGLLKISSTNLEIAITTLIRCKVEEEGGVTINAKTFTEMVNTLPNQNITLETTNGEVLLETENYHTRLKTLPMDEFPLIPEIEAKTTVHVNTHELKTSLSQVVFASSNNQTQPEICGILIKTDDKKIKIIATDRYRLAEKKIENKENIFIPQGIILPQKTIIEILRNIGNQTGDTQIQIGETQASFSINNTQIISRMVEGEYPPYEQIIPTSFNTEATVEKNLLINGLRAGGVLSQNNNSVKIDYSPEKQNIRLITESGELGKSEIDIPAKIDGQGGSLFVNFHYLLDCLLNLDSQNVVLKITNDSSPSVLVPENDENYIYLVMPIKT